MFTGILNAGYDSRPEPSGSGNNPMLSRLLVFVGRLALRDCGGHAYQDGPMNVLPTGFGAAIVMV
jgi:hypothetical protein